MKEFWSFFSLFWQKHSSPSRGISDLRFCEWLCCRFDFV